MPSSHKYRANARAVNVFDDMKRHQSILLTLFNSKNTEIVNVAQQAPSPSKDYCQLVLTHSQVIYRCWRITLHGDSESRYPVEIKDSYEEFVHDENIQRNLFSPRFHFPIRFIKKGYYFQIGNIQYIFGNNMFNYVKNIVEKGRLDILERLPERCIEKIVSYLQLEDIARLSQVNNFFRQLCRSDRVWINLYRQNYSAEITKELMQLAERDGWRKLFFTNKIKLQVLYNRSIFFKSQWRVIKFVFFLLYSLS
jgi:F-box protein 36